MSREKALIKNTIILSLGTYMPKMTTIITLPLLTGYLTQVEYGTYDLILTLISLLLPALTLQIQAAAFRFLITCRNSKKDIQEVVSNIFAFTIPVSAIGLFVTYFFLGRIEVSTRILILLYLFSDIIYIGCGQIARGLGKNFVYASGAVVVSVTNMLGICIALLVLKSGLDGILYSMLISNFIGNILIIARVKIFKYFCFSKISKKKIRELLSYSWPMVPNALSNWVLSLSNRVVILKFLGVEANAVFAVAHKIPNLVKTFQGTFTSAWQENASMSVKDEDSNKYYSEMFDNVNKIVVGLVAGLIAFTPVLFSVLIRGDYDEAYNQMSLLYIGMYFSCMSGFLGGIYIAHMKTKSVGITTVLAAICNFVINISTIKHMGLFAASTATLISYALLFIFRLIDVQRFQKLTMQYLKMFLYLTVLICMSIAVAQRLLWLNIINVIVGIAFAGLINRKIICTIMSGFVKRKKV